MKRGRNRVARLCVIAAAALALLPANAAAPAASATDALADLGQALLHQTATNNAVVSPLATAVALGLVQAGANGATEHEIENLFGAGRSGCARAAPDAANAGAPTAGRDRGAAGAGGAHVG